VLKFAPMRPEPEAPPAPSLTEDEFYALGDEYRDWEYLDGQLVKEPAATDRHEDLFAFLLVLLRSYLEERGGGLVRGSRYAMRLDPRWSPEPDLVVVRQERRHLMRPQRLEGRADLVIEIASPSDPTREARLKLPRYREARIPELWTIDPGSRSVLVEALQGQGYRSEILSGGRLASTVVPGFWIEVSWLWQEPLPPAQACLRLILLR
jgi:Uma2 family endonuclease